MSQEKCVYVLSDVDGYKYKLVVKKGNLDTLGTKKIKRYLEKAAHVPFEQQVLTFTGKVLADELSGKDIGLVDGSILFLQKQTFAPGKSASSASVERRPSFPLDHTSSRVTSDSPSCSIEYASGRTTLTEEKSASNRPKERLSRLSHNEVARASQKDSQWSAHVHGSAAVAHANGKENHSAPSAAVKQQDLDISDTREGETHSLENSDNEGSVNRSREEYGSDDSPLLQRPSDQQEEQEPAEHPAERRPSGQATSTQHPAPRSSLHLLEEENATLRKENRIISQHLKNAERRLANNDGDARLQEKIKALRKEMEHMKTHYLEMIAEQEEKWILKEEEFVRELDLLREERRRTKAEGNRFENEQQKLMCELETEARSRSREAQERSEEVRDLRCQVEELQLQLRQQAEDFSKERARLCSSSYRARHDDENDEDEVDDASLENRADSALQAIARVFHLDRALSFDPANNTCVIDVESSDGGMLSLLVTVDYTTERVYLYNALLHTLPQNPSTKLKLYESLLQSALLGKDMAGGGVGVSTESGMVLMSVFMDLRHGDKKSLASLAKPFLVAAEEWAQIVKNIVSIDA